MTSAKQLDLAGMAVVVTGSSSGIGQAIALELAATGADVLVHARRNLDGAEETVDRIVAQGRGSRAVLADLATSAEQDRLIEEAWGWRPRIDAWINNAGADTLTGDAASWPFEQKLTVLWQVDVTATMRLTRAVGNRMKQQGAGCIVNIGWDQAERGMAGDSGELFAATKGAVMAFSRSAALSLAPEVRVNCVAPGWIRTAWGEGASDAWQQRAVRESALARWGTPQDIADAVRFLVSPQSSFVTGQVLCVNGGLRREG